MSKKRSDADPFSAGRTMEEEEEERRQQAIRQAMFDDIGLGRLEELPLDDRRNDRNDRHRPNNHGGRAPNPSRQTAQPTRRAPKPNPRAQIWQAAINSGVFDDDDAAAVKGLDDLGGGRLYNQVRDQSLQILDQMQPPQRRRFQQPTHNSQRGAQPNPPHPRARQPFASHGNQQHQGLLGSNGNQSKKGTPSHGAQQAFRQSPHTQQPPVINKNQPKQPAAPNGSQQTLGHSSPAAPVAGRPQKPPVNQHWSQQQMMNILLQQASTTGPSLKQTGSAGQTCMPGQRTHGMTTRSTAKTESSGQKMPAPGPRAMAPQKATREPQPTAMGTSASATTQNTGAKRPDSDLSSALLNMTVGFYSKSAGKVVTAIVYLIPTTGSELGYLVTVGGDGEICRVQISRCNSVHPIQGDEHPEVWVEFGCPDGSTQVYGLYFRDRESQTCFVDTFRGLQGSQSQTTESLGQACETPSVQVTATSQAPNQVERRSSLAEDSRAVAHIQLPSASVNIPSDSVEPAPSTVEPVSDVVPGTPTSERDTLVDVEEKADEPTPAEPEQSATELLATLDPYDWDAEYYVHLQRVFDFARGDQTSAEMKEAMEDAIKAAIVIYRIQDDQSISRADAVKLADAFYKTIEGRVQTRNQRLAASDAAARAESAPRQPSKKQGGTGESMITPGCGPKKTEKTAEPSGRQQKKVNSASTTLVGGPGQAESEKRKRHYTREELFDCRDEAAEPSPELYSHDFLPLASWAKSRARPTRKSAEKQQAATVHSAAPRTQIVDSHWLNPIAKSGPDEAQVEAPNALEVTESRILATTEPVEERSQGQVLAAAPNISVATECRNSATITDEVATVDLVDIEDRDGAERRTNPGDAQPAANPTVSVSGSQRFGTMMSSLNRSIGLAGSRWAPQNVRSRSYLEDLAGLNFGTSTYFSPGSSQQVNPSQGRTARRRLVEEALARQASRGGVSQPYSSNIVQDSYAQTRAAHHLGGLNGTDSQAGSTTVLTSSELVEPPQATSHGFSLSSNTDQASGSQQRQSSRSRGGGLANSRHAH